ncbi:polysialyltransferase family glycosyltransferase [Aidingimonas lacisalsi]|uniref:polysialyltransferase family glycosyltransferase n=1 Tax=Aidingimonas lacisalsi TaxID=2604086 RepID=UPI0011D29614|nr:polysialyltransferase family glycosyltransferase [Aidingimonas lacisalsi]
MTARSLSLHVAIVAQTPFQYLSAILIRQASGMKCDLWLIDPSLKDYVDGCRNSELWERVEYLEVNKLAVGKYKLTDKIKRRYKIMAAIKRIKRYLMNTRPSAIVIFSDNHELTAGFARLGKIVSSSHVVMAEDGAAVYLSFKRTQTILWKRIFAQLINADNPNGYSIGWSPYIDSLLVSNPEVVHQDYVRDRKVFPYPAGPYPRSVMTEFIDMLNINLEEYIEYDRDIVLLGQPWAELGRMDSNQERKMLQSLGDSKFSSRILIKPHPFESINKYYGLGNIKVCSDELNRVPAEVVFELLHPSIVISIFSSAVFNYCLRNCKLGILLAFSSLPQEVTQFMKGKLSSYHAITIVKDERELYEAIERISQESANCDCNSLVEANDDSWRSMVREALILS